MGNRWEILWLVLWSSWWSIAKRFTSQWIPSQLSFSSSLDTFFCSSIFFFQNFPFSNICASMIWRWFTPHHIHRSFLINVGRILKFCWHILIALKLHLRSKCYVCNTYSYRYMTLKRTITFWKWPLGTHKLPIELDRCCLLMIVERRQTPS